MNSTNVIDGTDPQPGRVNHHVTIQVALRKLDDIIDRLDDLTARIKGEDIVPRKAESADKAKVEELSLAKK